MKKWLLSLLIILTVFLLGVPALAETGDPATPLESGIDALAGGTGDDAEETGKNFIYELTVDREQGTVSAAYSAEENAHISVKVYNDYRDETGKKLLFTLGPVFASAENESVTLSLPKNGLPDYFELESEITTVSGETTGYKTSIYTEDLQFALNATEADFPEGYYVKIDASNAPKLSKMPGLMKSAAADGTDVGEMQDGTAEGYFVYNTDLVLLPNDVSYTLTDEGEDRRVIFTSVPEELAGMTEQEIKEMKGFVIPAANVADADTFLLNGGMTVTPDGLSMKLAEPTSIDDLYATMNVTMLGALNAAPEKIDTEGVTGIVTRTQDFEVKIVRNGWKLNLQVSIGVSGSFQLTMSRSTFAEDIKSPSFYTDPSGKVKLAGPIKGSIGFNYKGFGMTTDTSFYGACTAPVYIEGDYGFLFYFRVGFSGLKYGSREEDVEFHDVVPLTPNRDTYAYFTRSYRFHLLGFYFDFKLFEIGPVFDLYFDETVAGRAIARWDQLDEEQQSGEDIIHTCIQPIEGTLTDVSGMPTHGCISGMAGSVLKFSMNFGVDLFFWDKTWKIAEKTSAPDEPDIDYFYHSLTFGDRKWEHGKTATCPHQLYRISAQTTENVKNDLPGSVISSEEGAIDLTYSVTTTDEERGIADPIYLPYIPDKTYTLKAVDQYGGFIAEEDVTPEDLVRHRRIVFDRNSTIITQVNLDGWFPHAVGETVYAGKKVSTGKQGESWHYRPYVTYEKGSGSDGDYGTGMDIAARWSYRVNGAWEEHYPETETRLSAQEGINRCEFELDFSTFGDVTARLAKAEDLWVLIMGKEGGNPITCSDGYSYRFGITGYQVEDKYYDNGDVRKNCILKIQAEFVVGDEDYVLVKVKNGLTAVSSHMYRSGDTAIVIGKDIGNTKYTIINELVPKLSAETWSPTEKEELKAEVFRQGPVKDPFGRWVEESPIYEAMGMLPFPSAYSPIITPDGVISYNTATFTVPKFTGTKKEIVVRAVYDLKDFCSINWINTDIKVPVPGESFGNVDDGYTVGKMTTDPGDCRVEGVSGENAGEVKLSWSEDGNNVSGKIRYNTVYTVTGTVRPRLNGSSYYRFRYPLASEDGTKAYITPIVSGEAEPRDEALSFESVSQYPEEIGMELPVADDETAVFTYLFVTPMAQLLEVIQPDDLYYPVGIQPEVINEYLRFLRVGIITEDETVTSSDVEWETVTEVPGAGKHFTVPGSLLLPDGIRNEEEAGHHKVDEAAEVTIHIYGADELEPPAADPAPGIYRRDIRVALTHKDPDAIIHYRVLGKDEEFKEYTDTIPFNCEEGHTVTYTVEAYAEKTVPAEESPTGETQTFASEHVTFNYVLMPRGGDFVLNVIAGSASSNVGSGSGQLYMPAGTEVMLSPIEDDVLEFDHWELDHTPAGFSWIDGTGKTTPNARFNMPAEDLTVTGYYMPKKGERIISRIQMEVEDIRLGYTKEQMPEHDIYSTVRLDIFDKRSEFPSMVSLRFKEATNLWWDEWNNVYPVTYGTYAFDAMYLINSEKEEPAPEEEQDTPERTMPMGLVELSMRQLPSQSIPYEYWVKEADRFAPYLTATVNRKPASVIVSEDGKRVMVHYEFEFLPETYTLRYDANGGVLSEVPPQVIQLVTIPTALTDKEPYHNNGRKFLGWSTDPAATEPEYVYDPAQESPVTFDKDTTLYAVWGPPYGVEVRWLDADNAANTRQSFTISFADGTTLIVDPKDAAEVNGVGIERYDLPELSAAYADTATIEGAENGFVRFGDVDGKRNVYAVEKECKDGQLVITLTAMRLFGVEKDWDIDFEGHDRPKSVKMILQSTKPLEDEGTKLMRLLMEYLSDSSAENRDKIISELEKIIGYSLKGLSPEAVAGKVMHLIVSGQFSAANLTDSLKKLLTADTDDSNGWYAWQTVKVGEDNDWKADFKPTDRFEGKITVNEDGSLSAEWNGERKYRVVEKAGKTPVENGGDAVFTVPEYTNIVGNVIEEHKTVYVVRYSSKNDKTTVTNTAVEDHYLLKEWVMLGDAKKPENVYVMLLWQYDPDYLKAVQDLIDVELPSLWLPEDNPIKGSMISVYDIIASIDPTGLSGLLKPILGKLKIPLAIAKLNEGNNWRGYFRVRKYGNFGLPLKHEGAEFFSAICQDVIKYFFGVEIPIGVNPLQGFISVSVPEVDVPYTTDKLDAVVNTWYKGPDDPDDPDDKPNKIGGSKVWEDDSNKDGIRPEKITLHIYEDGVDKIADITVTRADNAALDGKNYWVWTYKNDCIDTKHHTYTVTEDPVEGYETKIDGLNVTNTHTTIEQKYVDLSVTKTWDEETPATHDPITTKIMQNGKLFRTVILSEENAWTQKLTDLEKVDAEGRTYTYSVEEIVPDGYTVSYDVHFDSAANEWICYITNKPADPEKTVIKGKKIWDDDNDKYAARPESVTVRLYANVTEIDAFELNATNAWSWSREVDETDETGASIKYTVTEDAVEGYETKIDGLNVTNRMNVPPTETVDIEVIKKWEKTDDTHPAVPVILQLLRNGEPYGSTFILDETNGWEKLFEKVDRKDTDGRDYAYAVKEIPVPEGFAESYETRFDTARSRFILTVTNKAVAADEKKIGGTKTWDDKNDAAGVRPASVEYLILANGEAVDRKVLNANTGWTWSGAYPVADEKGQITYSVMESPVPYYTAEYSADELSVTNKLTLATVTVNKRWRDGDNADGVRPEKVEVAVLAATGGKEPAEVAVVTLTGGATESAWSGSVTVAAVDEYGQARSFSIREIDITDYVVSYDEPVHNAEKHTWTFGITNTLVGTLQITNTVLHGDKTTPIPFTVELKDGSGNGYSGKIEAELTHTGETSPVSLSFVKGKAAISLAHGDNILLQDVPVGWRYTVRETAPYGYRTWVIDPDNEAAAPAKLLAAPKGDGYPAYTTAVKKYGANTADFYNDTGFTVTGLKLIDGKEAGADAEGLFMFELLYEDMTPVMDENGVPIQATNAADGTFVLEAAIPLTGKTAFYVREMSDAALSEKYVMDTTAHPVTVEADTNGKLIASPDPVTVNNSTLTILTVNKQWVGSEGGAIMLDLYANGSAVSGYTPVRNGNTYIFSGLPRTDEKGDEIVWSAKERPVEGFYTSYHNTGAWSDKKDAAYDQCTIVNRKTVSIVIYKEWKGKGKHPDSITLDVYCDGEFYRSETRKPHSDGSITLTLPMNNHNGEEAVYTFTEQPIKKYKTEYRNVSPYEDVKDKLYPGGTIVNCKDDPVPPTGDKTPILPLILINLSAAMGLCVSSVLRRRRKA